MKKALASLAVMIMVAGVIPAHAQYGPYDQGGPAGPTPGPSQQQPAETQPGVARVSFMSGDVSSQRGDNGDWVAVTVNTPISPDDRVATGQNSRAELQLDYADILRMSDSATAKIAGLNRNHIQVQIGQGLVTYSVFKGSEADSEIDTPNASVHPNGPGEYRILVNSDSETEVIVREGSVDISTPQGSTHVDSGQMIEVQGTDNPQYRTTSAPARDDWDSWNNERNGRIENAQSWRKTDRYYTGSEDLDGYGRWEDVPDYGPVWLPQQGPDWAPYRDGRWVYDPYYGWTWVSYEPWGWAPYHYGRWFVYGGSWVWWPGPVVAYPAYYPIWAPAYVSFFGWGGGGFGFSIGFGFGFGRFGWLPVGPCDGFHPWWGAWGNRVNVVNITNIHNSTFINNRDGFGPLVGNNFRGQRFSNLDEAFRNERVRNGISSMAGSEFGRSRVSMQQARISEASLRQASMMTGKMPVTPSRESFSPSGRMANPSAFSHATPSSQRFFTPSMQHGAQPVSGFSNASRGAAGFGSNARSAVQSSRPGWRTFTPPSNAGNANTGANNAARGGFAAPSRPSAQGSFQSPSAGAQNENRNSWQHFTPPSSASRGNSSNSYSRSPLNMRQPIVTPRGGGYYGNGRYSNSPNGGSRGYNAPRGGGNYSAPRGGGNYSAPRGSSSAPRGNGGGNRGGGGGGRTKNHSR